MYCTLCNYINLFDCCKDSSKQVQNPYLVISKAPHTKLNTYLASLSEFLLKSPSKYWPSIRCISLSLSKKAFEAEVSEVNDSCRKLCTGFISEF